VGWLRASLLVNGLAPADVPPELLGPVLAILVRTGRTVPPEAIVSSLEAAQARQDLLGAVRRNGASPPAPEPTPG
jgi:hypothetical protein